MMKVLFITNYPVPYRVDFFNELGKLCDLTVLFEQHPDEVLDRNHTGMTESFRRFHGEFFRGPRMRLGYYYMNFEALVWLRRTQQFDVVVFGIYSSPTQAMMITFMKLLGWSYVLNSDGGFIKKDAVFSRLLKRFLIGRARLYLASGEGTRRYLQYYGAELNRVRVFPFTSLKQSDIMVNPAPVDKKTELRIKYGFNEKQIILGVGQFVKRKGWDVLLKAARFLPQDIGIYIIGGIETEEYRDLINEYGLKAVHFIPFKGKEILYDYYSLADVFVLPTREDIWGLVINEAMAHGLPVITTKNCLAGLELVEDGVNGYLIDSEDVDALAKMINLILEDDDLRVQMAQNNCRKVQDYTIENMASVTNEILLSMIETTDSNQL